MAMINMNSLPTEKPSMGAVIPKGQYLAKIVKAEMKQPKEEEKPMYFSAECDITDIASGHSMGKFWVNLFESEAPLCRYQLSRFIQALNLPIQGEFELKDLTKMVAGKELKIDIQPEDKPDPQRSVVDITAQCFYPVTDPRLQAAEEVLSAQTTESAPQVMASY